MRFSGERFFERGISELHSADVRDVFALSQLTIDVQARQRLIFGILLHDCL